MALETKLDLNQETVNQLQDLIRINIDSSDGFEFSADQIDDPALKSRFTEFARRRREHADELATYVAWNREDPVREGSYAASMHRTWMSIREMFSSDDLYTVLAEAERGEDYIVQAYKDALKSTTGSAMNDVLLRQASHVKSVHDEVKQMRDMRKVQSK